MKPHELAQALAALSEDHVAAIVGAASNLRTAESALSTLVPARKGRGPAKKAPVTAPKASSAAPAKRRGRPPLPKSPAFSSALDKLASVKTGDVKVRRPSISSEESDD